jgi:hypothetical protein
MDNLKITKKENVLIVTETAGTKNTNAEMNECAIEGLEKYFATGPLIGSYRKMVLHLLCNIQARDMILTGMGLAVEPRMELLQATQKYMDDADKELLAARKKAKQQ